EVLHHGALRRGLLRLEQCHAGLPPVFEAELIGLAALALADDHLDAVVAHVERLPAALHAVAEHRDRFVLEDLLDAVERIIGALDGLFYGVADANLFHGVYSLEVGGRIFCVREATKNYLDVKNSNMDTTDATHPAESPKLGEPA